MARNWNIEILRQQKQRHTAAFVAVCTLVLVLCLGALPGTQAQYAAADDDTHVFVFTADKDVQVSLSETWNAESGLNLTPGSTVVKRPSVQNERGDCYMRVLMRVVDAAGNTITPESDSERLNFILGAIWADPEGVLQDGSAYDTSMLAAKAGQGVNNIYNAREFAAGEWNAELEAYTFAYSNQETNNIFKAGAKATIFDHIVIPANYSAADITTMGEYSLVIWAQAIQAEGFESERAAMDALSNSYRATESLDTGSNFTSVMAGSGE